MKPFTILPLRYSAGSGTHWDVGHRTSGMGCDMWDVGRQWDVGRG
eukprot:CAMPEP_0174386182 /NCGR_PEP_ID=MMETSP0811_2-20130205/127105_1 /TAXON_ID=73025 ORGANISM="Eutreptiella gymnastica-like, Strain CCMP1594" /NCGR_SAMPLE_ID=MMETSP0811_2 /ASSEMBLY_ACC=CAM_ASM_000667 /LENGTH=44 /DNA_ID= /DNA_START= /DNA_END= /DNA_ORIENTATION=